MLQILYIFILALLAVKINAAKFADNAKEVFNIGAVLSSGQNIAHFLQEIESSSILLPGGTEVLANTLQMTSNPIRTAQAVCDNLITRQVFAVIVSHPTSGEGSPSSVSFTCGFYDIPVIGISNRDSSLSNKNLHNFFMRTIPPYSHQADVWIEMIRALEYRSVVFIHSSDNDGRSTLGRFQNLADGAKVKVEKVIEYGPKFIHFAEELQAARRLSCRVYIVYANKEDAETIFAQIQSLNMTSSGFVWLVTEQALNASNKPNGILGLKLIDGDNEEAHIKDSVKVVMMALRDLYLKKNITKPPNDCGKTGENKWATGADFLKTLKQQRIKMGATGRVAFDENGDRLESNYDILNFVDGKLIRVGNYSFTKSDDDEDTRSKSKFVLNLDSIIWPGNERKKPLGYYVPTHLRVATITEKPFVYSKLPLDGKCLPNQMLCTRYNLTRKMHENYCCEGYCMDLLRRLSQNLNFTFDLHIVADGLFGSQEFDENGKRKWNGLVAELVYKKADMVIAPLTINPERAKVMDFSKPFKYHGIAMLQKRLPKGAKLTSFLQPFQHTLWVLVMVSVHVVALVLYCLDRLSPFGRYGHEDEEDQLLSDEKALNFSSAIWFAWGVLLNSGVGEKTPRSFSARVLGMVWAGFAMIVVASYTANLAAFLVLDSTETEITGLEDSRLRNPAEGFKYATVKGSAVDVYFRGQVELSNMYRLMEETNKNTAEEAIEDLKTGALNVFFWDQPRLEFEAASDCNLVISGETFGRTGYGIGLQKNSFWTHRTTLEILNATESGFMETLDNKWILKSEKGCENKLEHFPTTLTMENMAGVFMLVAAGILTSIGLIIIEIGYKRRKARRLQKVKSVKKAVQKWKTTVEKRKLMKSSCRRPMVVDAVETCTVQSSGRNPPPPLPFKRSSQNYYGASLDRQRKCFDNSIYLKQSLAPDSVPFTIEKSMNEIIGRNMPLPQQQCLQPHGQQLLSPHYPHFNRQQMMTGAAAVAATSLPDSRYSDADMDIPPPPPPPSASPRSRPTHPLMSYPKKSKNFIPG
ncbi:glutamate [NMDA] receptor subunit 1-like protein [Dinothrombium tinctorium]|uniref:Glutamate [NMDA] receptor subunit 1-like protein n=1 Tax=Dinothrombium tinctorium TaxID=1965070 RepID=A0A3S3PZL9_9ACAR|nr:glutamate [NMDA] receptor subunit 1-like protein [Dinothrombium tinctorium]